jgi:addiction module HigA family antidote
MRTKSASKTITRDPNWLGPAIPPGEILLEEYLKPLGVGQLEAAKRLGISLNRLNEIVLGKRAITADTALRVARWLKNVSAALDAAAGRLGFARGPDPLVRRSAKCYPVMLPDAELRHPFHDGTALSSIEFARKDLAARVRRSGIWRQPNRYPIGPSRAGRETRSRAIPRRRLITHDCATSAPSGVARDTPVRPDTRPCALGRDVEPE